MDNKFKVFGAALDAYDDPLKIMAKISYLNRLSQNLIDLETEFRDPYEGILKNSKVLSEKRFKKIGKFPIESWVTPKPDIDDFPLLDPIEFQNFVNNGALLDYTIKLEQYVKENVLPDIPLMIGVDHSLTGGVLKALSKNYDNRDILVIIFDSHFDGIPAGISLQLAKYAKEHKDELNFLFPEKISNIDENLKVLDTYSYASFIHYLIEDKTIVPENLIIFGCQDYPDKKLQSIDDERVKKYVDFYLSFEKKGVKFIPVSENTELMIEKLEKVLRKIEKPYIYISFDVDIGIFKEILAARFMNVIGIDMEIILEAANKIKEYIILKKCNLIGIDILEIDTYMLGKILKKSGRTDKTIEVIDKFLKIITHKIN